MLSHKIKVFYHKITVVNVNDKTYETVFKNTGSFMKKQMSQYIILVKKKNLTDTGPKIICFLIMYSKSFPFSAPAEKRGYTKIPGPQN